MKLPESARSLIESGVHAHLYEVKKVQNIRGDGRVAITFESDTKSEMGFSEYLVIYGQAAGH